MSQGTPKGKGGTVVMSNFNPPPVGPQPPVHGGQPPHPESPYGASPGAPYNPPPGAPYNPPPGAPYNPPPAGYGPPPGAPAGANYGAPPGGGYGPPPGAQPGWGAPPPAGMAPPPAGGFGVPRGFGGPVGGPVGAALATSGSSAIPDYTPGEKTQTLGLDQNLAAAISHFVGILALVFAFTEPKHHRFIRFYSFQIIFFGVLVSVLVVVAAIVAFILGMILPNSLSFLAGVVFLPFIVVGPIALWAAYKSFQGKVWKIPVVGNFAEKFALKD